MYPDQNQYSIDYLNQIAPAPQKPKLGGKWGVIGLIVVVLLVAVIGVSALSKMSAGPTQNLKRFAAQVTSLQTIADGAQPDLAGGLMRSSNSNLSIFLANTSSDMIEPLKKFNIKADKIDKSIIKQEANTEMIATLEDARLNAVLDGVYSREMGLKLAELTALMEQIYNKTNSKSLKAFLVSTDKNLDLIRKQLSEASTASAVKQPTVPVDSSAE